MGKYICQVTDEAITELLAVNAEMRVPGDYKTKYLTVSWSEDEEDAIFFEVTEESIYGMLMGTEEEDALERIRDEEEAAWDTGDKAYYSGEYENDFQTLVNAVLNAIRENDLMDMEDLFSLAVQAGNEDFIRDNCDKIELNDEDGCPYLEDAKDRYIEKVLYDCGAFPNIGDYEGCSFACETSNDTVLSFTDDFYDEVIDRFYEKLDLDEDSFPDFYFDNEEDDDISWLPDALADVCDVMGILIDDDEITYEVPQWGDEGGRIIGNLLEALGYKLNFDGPSLKSGAHGVYFID